MSLEDREIRAADAGGDHAELDLAFTRLGFIQLLDLDLSNFTAHSGFHAIQLLCRGASPGA